MEENYTNSIAIIGMACRFPKANNVKTYWRNICDGLDAITEVPEDRWNGQHFLDESMENTGKSKTRWGGFLDRIDLFDAPFFGISPREASRLDPQQRLLLEVSWEALEDSGLVSTKLTGSRTGVFIGGFTVDHQIKELSESNLDLIDINTSTGVMATMLSNRLSYFYDFRGPSMSIDTACSSSLVATHLACESIRNDECEMAVAGGVSVLLVPQYFVAESQGGFLSVDGRCKSFDHRANGYVRSEGAGIVLLKSLEAAQRDGNQIHAIIRGSAVNSDGRSKGITVPNKDAQLAVMRQAYKKSGVDPRDIQYVEAHGTGTPVGDPLETTALNTMFSEGRTEESPCFIGSVKSNIGHLEAASGIASVIKTVMILKHKIIPKNLHIERFNPEIPFDQRCVKVPQQLEQWPDNDKKALAGINSFGFGGTNAHMILEEAPSAISGKKSIAHFGNDPITLPLSAKSGEALVDYAREVRNLLNRGIGSDREGLNNLCYSAVS